MKHTIRLIMAVALCASTALASSCALQKSDAIALGQQLATGALALSLKKLSGEHVNLKREAFTLGSELAESAIVLSSTRTGVGVDAKALVDYAVKHAGIEVAKAPEADGDPATAAAVVSAASEQAVKELEARAPPL